jgi:hypothetical protein
MEQNIDGNNSTYSKHEIQHQLQETNTNYANEQIIDWDGYREYLQSLNKCKKCIQTR